MRKFLIAIMALVAMLVVVAAGSASTSTSGTTTVQQDSNGLFWNLTSNSDGTYGSIDWTPDSAMTLSDINNLSATMEMTDGVCAGGAPRFSIELADGANIFVYIGGWPSTSTCQDGIFDTGNLLTQGRVDATQEGLGYPTWSDLVAELGDEPVDGISYVIDAGWAQDNESGIQAANVYNLEVNRQVILPNLTPAVVAQVGRVTACASKPVFRVGDGSYGIFADLDQATFDSGTFQGATFTPSLFVQGVGATCDVPAGYHYAGHSVDASGNVDTTGANNIHPLYTK